MRYLILILIIAGSLFIRGYAISSTPEINADEAALAYNAYSLLETGKDEFGTPWPLVFRSFDDYKPGVYVYLAVPFIKIFGLTPLAVRLPSLIMSLISVFIIYFLGQKLFATSRHRVAIGLISSLILAVMPWHIHFSRGAWETQVATTFLTIGTYFFTLIPKRRGFLFLGLINYFIALYTYHSMRVIVPLFILFWAIKYQKVWRKIPKLAIGGIIFCIIAILPMASQILSPNGLSRAQGVSLLADSGPTWRSNELRSYHELPSPLIVRAAYNKPLMYASKFFNNYIGHFSLNFLFYDGELIERNRVPEFGQLLFVCLPFFLVGLWYIIRQTPKRWPLLTFWLITAPIPSALTFQSPHAVRAFSMTIPLALIAAYGIVNLISTIRQNWGNWVMYIAILGTLVIFICDFSRYLTNYYLLLPYHFPNATQSGFSQLVPWVEGVKSNYSQIVITDKYDQPYILFLFFSKYPPFAFQSQAQVSSRDRFGFGTVRKYDNYHFESIDFESLKQTDEKILVIGTKDEIPPDSNIINTIRDKYGRIIFEAAQIN